MNDLPPADAAGTTPRRPRSVAEDPGRPRRTSRRWRSTQLLTPMFDTVDTAHGPFGGGDGEAAWKPMMVTELAKQMAAHGGLGLAQPVHAADAPHAGDTHDDARLTPPPRSKRMLRAENAALAAPRRAARPPRCSTQEARPPRRARTAAAAVAAASTARRAARRSPPRTAACWSARSQVQGRIVDDGRARRAGSRAGAHRRRAAPPADAAPRRRPRCAPARRPRRDAARRRPMLRRGRMAPRLCTRLPDRRPRPGGGGGSRFICRPGRRPARARAPGRAVTGTDADPAAGRRARSSTGMLLPRLRHRLDDAAGRRRRRAGPPRLRRAPAATTARARRVRADRARRCCRGCRRVVATSRPGRRAAGSRVRRRRAAVVTAGRAATCRAAPDPAAPGCILLSVGVLTPRKGHDRAAARAGPADRPATGASSIAGDAGRDPAHAAELAALIERARPRAPRHAARRPRRRRARSARGRRADLFALATQWEGYPAGVAEALRRGIPVVVTNGGDAGDLVPPDAGVGLRAGRPGDASAKCLRRLLFDRDLRADMAEARLAGRAGAAELAAAGARVRRAVGGVDHGRCWAASPTISPAPPTSPPCWSRNGMRTVQLIGVPDAGDDAARRRRDRGRAEIAHHPRRATRCAQSLAALRLAAARRLPAVLLQILLHLRQHRRRQYRPGRRRAGRRARLRLRASPARPSPPMRAPSTRATCSSAPRC